MSNSVKKDLFPPNVRMTSTVASADFATLEAKVAANFAARGTEAYEELRRLHAVAAACLPVLECEEIHDELAPAVHRARRFLVDVGVVHINRIKKELL